jgi:hypothetical protein
MTRQITLTNLNRKGNTTDMKIYNSMFLLIFFLNFNIFCMKAHQLSIVLPFISRLVQLRIYTSYTKICFFYFSRMTYFWSFVLFRCYHFIRFLYYFLHAKHVFSNQFGWYLSFNCVITEKCVFFYNDPILPHFRVHLTVFNKFTQIKIIKHVLHEGTSAFYSFTIYLQIGPIANLY